MPYKDLVKGWHEGVLALEKNDLDTALNIFLSLEEPHSKIWFNVGYVHLQRGSPQEALQAFNKTLTKDCRLAVGFFQRGIVHLQLELYEEALSDCRLALTHLRNNAFIDYSQLGLRHILYAWELLYNTAAVQCALGQWRAAQECLEEAIRQQPEAGAPGLEAALVKVQKRLSLEPVLVPQGKFFRPRKQEVDQLNFKVFLGTPKVISSVIPNDEYIGFEPLRPQKPGFYEPCPDAMQSQDAGYHRVLVHYYPKDNTELVLKANTLVFVLHKEDEWATVIHDGQKILLPTSLLELVGAPKAENRNVHNGIPLPPLKLPPSRPQLRSALEVPLPLQRGNPPEDVPASPPRPTADSAKLYTDLVYQEAPSSSREPRKETSLALQNSSYQEASSTSGEPRKETSLPLQSSTYQEAPSSSRQPRKETSLPLQSSTYQEAPSSSRQPRKETSLPLQSSTYQEAPSSSRQPRKETSLALQSSDDESPESVQGAELLQEGALSEAQRNIVLEVHCTCTVSLQVSPETSLPDLQVLLRERFRCQAQRMPIQLSYRDPNSKVLTPVSGDKDLEKVWELARDGRVTLWCKESEPSTGRSILYQMVAQYGYTADGPEDLQFQKGDLLDILSEVNEDWLEGHCHGKTGIFPKCFAARIADGNSMTLAKRAALDPTVAN